MTELMIYHHSQTCHPEAGTRMKKFARTRNLPDPMKDKISTIALSIWIFLKLATFNSVAFKYMIP